MADRRGARSSTRSRVTPQPAHVPSAAATPSSRGSRRSNRVTASQEREKVSLTHPNTRNTRQLRATSAETNASNRSRNSTRARGARKGAQKVKEEFPTVPEVVPSDSEDDDDEDDDDEEEPMELPREHAEPSRTSGVTAVDTAVDTSFAASNISGTTAYSHVEAQELDYEQMLDELDGLYSNSKRFLNKFVPEDADVDAITKLHKALLSPGSRAENNFKRSWQTLEPLIDVYTGEQKKYVNINTVLRALFKIDSPGDFSEKISSAQGRPDPVLYLANLAIFIQDILPGLKGKDASYDRLCQIDSDFPKMFLSGFAKPGSGRTCGYSKELRPTFSLALEIRTQIAIQHLQRQENDGRDVDALAGILEDIFFAPRPDGTRDVRGWEIDGLGHQTEIQPGFRDRTRNRYAQLEALLREATIEDGVDFDQFERMFPWVDFLSVAIHWVKTRIVELESVINVDTDVSTLTDKLRQEIEEFRRQASVRRKSRRSHGAHSVVPSGIVTLKLLEAEAELLPEEEGQTEEVGGMEGTDAVVQVDEVIPESSNAARRPYRRPFVDEDADDYQEDADEDQVTPGEEVANDFTADDEIRSTQSTLRRLAELERLKKGKEKENFSNSTGPSRKRRFIDQQAEAAPVDFGDGFEASQASEAGPSNTQPSRSSRKRLREEDDEGVSEDEGFQQDNRPIDTERRKRFAVPNPSSGRPQPSPSRTRQGVRHSTAAPPRGSAQRPNPSPRPTTHPMARTQSMARQQARENVAANRGWQPRGKNPWTFEEEVNLENAIADHGCNWALLRDLENAETGEPLFPNRDNVAIKDKARNMKMNYYKAYKQMPPNFEHISLGRRLEEILINQGFTLDAVVEEDP